MAIVVLSLGPEADGHEHNISVGRDVCFPGRPGHTSRRRQLSRVTLTRAPGNWLQIFEDGTSELIDQLTRIFQDNVSISCLHLNNKQMVLYIYC